MFKQIKGFGVEITNPLNDDLLPIQQASGISGHIKREDFLTGISIGGSDKKYIQLSYTVPPNTSGGNASTSWAKRPINKIDFDDTGLVTLSNNEFILPAGEYILDCVAQFYHSGRVRVRLFNHTSNQPIANSLSYYSGSADTDNPCTLRARFLIAGVQSFSLQHIVSNTSGQIWGLGNQSSLGIDEIYLIASLTKIA